jgi:hypothetical protein
MNNASVFFYDTYHPAHGCKHRNSNRNVFFFFYQKVPNNWKRKGYILLSSFPRLLTICRRYIKGTRNLKIESYQTVSQNALFLTDFYHFHHGCSHSAESDLNKVRRAIRIKRKLSLPQKKILKLILPKFVQNFLLKDFRH